MIEQELKNHKPKLRPVRSGAWWRRQVGLNHTPQGGAFRLSDGGQNLMASASQLTAF